MTALYCDAATLADIEKYAADARISGFTTNPSLMKKAGITHYRDFAKEVLDRVGLKPVSFEVLADERDALIEQARDIALWSPNVWVKVPVTNTAGLPNDDAIHELRRHNLNITAVMTRAQVDWLSRVTLQHHIVSVFAGRIADTGVHPFDVVLYAKEHLACQVLWASARQVYDVNLAEMAGCDIITLTPELIEKLKLKGKDLAEYSLETVRMFYNDGKGIAL